MGADVVIISVVVIAVALVAVRYVRNIAHGGCNCGCGGSAPRKKVGKTVVADTDEGHYPYSVDLPIGGMSCQGCAENVQNALNALDGTWARVDLDARMAHVLTKQPADAAALEAAVRSAGYYVLHG